MRKVQCAALAAVLVALLALACSPVAEASNNRSHAKNRIAFDVEAETAGTTALLAEDNGAAALSRPSFPRRKRLPTCAAGETPCRGFCADLLQSDIHCGACGNVCTSSETCCGGVCTDTTTAAHCGGCGNACPAGGSCVNGLCTTTSRLENLRRSLVGY